VGPALTGQEMTLHCGVRTCFGANPLAVGFLSELARPLSGGGLGAGTGTAGPLGSQGAECMRFLRTGVGARDLAVGL
jgi:hypothetical protein